MNEHACESHSSETIQTSQWVNQSSWVSCSIGCAARKWKRKCRSQVGTRYIKKVKHHAIAQTAPYRQEGRDIAIMFHFQHWQWSKLYLLNVLFPCLSPPQNYSHRVSYVHSHKDYRHLFIRLVLRTATSDVCHTLRDNWGKLLIHIYSPLYVWGSSTENESYK